MRSLRQLSFLLFNLYMPDYSGDRHPFKRQFFFLCFDLARAGGKKNVSRPKDISRLLILVFRGD